MGPHIDPPSASTFLSIRSRSDLASWLGLTDRQLRFLLYVLPENKKYTTFAVAKRNGGTRTIDAPTEGLKAIQRRVMRALVDIAPATGLAKAYVQGVGTIDHAWLHRRQRHIALVDISDFFPSITFPRVRGAFMARPFGFTPNVATCLAQLCCKGGALPQGAPTSPVISNLICRSLDFSLLRLSKRHRFRVSRYADDICLSTSRRDFPSSIVDASKGPAVPGEDLVSALGDAGFRINLEKFKVKSSSTRQLVTGLIVNEGVSLPRNWRRQLRVLLHLVKKHGEDRAREIYSSWPIKYGARGNPVSIEQVIRGKANFAQYVDRRCNRRFTESLSRGYKGQRKLIPRPLNGTSFRVMSEGKTDLLHLEAAHKEFLARGDFGSLRPEFANFPGDSSDVELLKTLQRLAKVGVSQLTVGVFDCDSDKFMKNNSLAPGCYVQLSENVYAMCLARSLEDGEPFCIESLYDLEDLTRSDPDGRRLFLREEFDATTGLTADGIYKRVRPAAKALIVSDPVERLSDGFSALLSKARFAELVHSGAPPFDRVSFEGFLPTFRVMEVIVDRWRGR